LLDDHQRPPSIKTLARERYVQIYGEKEKCSFSVGKGDKEEEARGGGGRDANDSKYLNLH